MKRLLFITIFLGWINICNVYAHKEWVHQYILKEPSYSACTDSNDSTGVFMQNESRTYPQVAIYPELLGNSLILSPNIDLRFFQFLSLRLGLMVAMVNTIIGSRDHTLEIGFGRAGVVIPNIGGGEGRALYYWTGTIAYRYQPIENGLFCKIGLTPIFKDRIFERFTISLGPEHKVLLWAGLSIGYTF